MNKYTKKPVTIEAKQITYFNRYEIGSGHRVERSNHKEIAKWINESAPDTARIESGPSLESDKMFTADIRPWLYIKTAEGELKASDKDYIIKGVEGEFYSCKPDIFAATYVKAVGEHTEKHRVETNTFKYVKYDNARAAKQEAFKEKFEDLESLAHELLEPGRYKSLFLTGLEEVYMWCGKAIRDEQIAATGAQHEPSRTDNPE